ncbi:hypothetical protein [Gimesia alba]|nr:hypothetical protein [Gimesia alba]
MDQSQTGARNPKWKHRGNILGVILILLTLSPWIYGYLTANAANAQLIGIYQKAEIGGSFNKFKANVRDLSQSHLTAHFWEYGALFDTPLLLGAVNWRLYIRAEDNQIQCVKIRTEDSQDQHPSDAPPDKGDCRCRLIAGEWVEL